MPTKQVKIDIPNCSQCHIIHEFQWSCHFIRLILCDEHYGRVDIDKMVTKGDGVAMEVKKHGKKRRKK